MKKAFCLITMFILAAAFAVAAPDTVETYNVVTGLNSIHIYEGCTVESGNIAVMDAAPGPVLANGAEVSIDQFVRVEDNISISADTVYIKYGSTVFDVFCNELLNYGDPVRNNTLIPLALPLTDELPEFPITMTGTDNLSVPAYTSLVLEPGHYRHMSVYEGANLILTGGTYYFYNLKLRGNWSAIFARGPVDVIVENQMTTETGVAIRADNGYTVEPKDIRFFIKGESTGPHTGMTAASFGQYSLVNGLIYAPNGTVKIKEGCTFEGAVIGKDVRIEKWVLLRLR